MTEQPEALRLADELDRVAKWSDSEHWDTLKEAAAELRRRHPSKEPAMTKKYPEHTASIFNVFDTAHEAEAFRKTLMYADKYGLYGMCQSEEKQLWVAMPKVVLEALNNFEERAGEQK